MNTRETLQTPPLTPRELSQLRRELRYNRKIRIIASDYDPLADSYTCTIEFEPNTFVAREEIPITLSDYGSVKPDRPDPTSGRGFDDSGCVVDVVWDEHGAEPEPAIYTASDLRQAQEQAVLRTLQMLDSGGKSVAVVGLFARVCLHVLKPSESAAALAARCGVSGSRICQLSKRFRRLLKRF